MGKPSMGIAPIAYNDNREITVRQQETVIKMLDDGKRVQDIAARLKISDNQVRHVKYKLERYG